MKNLKYLSAAFAAAMLFSGCASSDTEGNSSVPAETSAETTAEAAAENSADTAAADSSAETDSSAEASADEPITPKVNEYDPDKPVIALTFDDGPNTTNTPLLLDKLEEYDAVGSFFLIGNNIDDESAQYVKRAYEMGCEIGNHSLTHSTMTSMTGEKAVEEVQTTNQMIKYLIGVEPVFFRPPFNAANSTMYDNIDMTFVMGFGCDDWESDVTVEQRIDGVLSQARDGGIILLHDQPGNTQTIDALDTIIPELREEGYQLVTVSQLFEAKGQDPNDEILYRDRVVNYVEEY